MEYIDEGQARLEPFRFPKGYRGPDFSVWYVTSSGEFFPVSHRERPGVQLPFSGEFSFAGYRWLVPGVYSTAKALVVDLCREVPLQAIQDFIQKWNLTPENDDSDCFSKVQRMEMEAENPQELEISPTAVVNGREHPYRRGTGLFYCAKLEWPGSDLTGEAVAKHYGLNQETGWNLWRYVFPWGRRKQVNTLSLTLQTDRARWPGTPFQVKQAGEQVELIHPRTGESCTLTVRDFQRDALDSDRIPGREEWEFPNHLWRFTYTVEPEVPGLTIEDGEEGDRPRPKPRPETGRGDRSGEGGSTAAFVTAQPEAASIGIIGGADGPTAIFLRDDKDPRRHTAFSALRFQPEEPAAWLPVFRDAQGKRGHFVLQQED